MAGGSLLTEQYELHQVERDELHDDWIWLRNQDLRPDIEGLRPAVLFEYTADGKSRRVCCETLYADDQYLLNRHQKICPKEKMGKNLIFINAWYRKQLGIEWNGPKMINVGVRVPRAPVQAVWWQLRACARHPQIAVVMATVLAIIGTGLGLAGAATVLTDIPWLTGVPCVELVSHGIAIIGCAVFLLGFVPLFLRTKRSR
jgi:hypothetical protein